MKTKLYVLLNELFLWIEFTYFRHLYDEKEALKKQVEALKIDLATETAQRKKNWDWYVKFWHLHNEAFIKLRNLNLEVDKTHIVLKKIAGRYEWLESRKDLMYTDKAGWIFATDAAYRMELARERLRELA